MGAGRAWIQDNKNKSIIQLHGGRQAATHLPLMIDTLLERDHTSELAPSCRHLYRFPQFYKLYILVYVPHPLAPFQFFNFFPSI